MDLERYTELANKIMGNGDPEQKHKGLSNLIERIAAELPDAITVEHRGLVLSNHTLRFNDYWSNVYLFGSGIGFRDCVNLITQHRDEVEQWECDDEVTIADRKAKLKRYAQSGSIKLPPKVSGYRKDGTAIVEYPIDPNSIYCEKGIYRKYDQLKDGYYYRLGRMIQTADPDGNLKQTMQAVCLMVALNNERTIVEDELTLLGIEIQKCDPIVSKIDENRQMVYTDISELREAANGYLFLLRHHDFGHNDNESVTRLHRAIANLDLGAIGSVLARFNVNQSTVIGDGIEPLLEILGELDDTIGRNMAKIKKDIDPNVGSVFNFCKEASKVLRVELEKLETRRFTDPTTADECALRNFQEYGLGSYGDITLDDFIKEYIIKDEPHIAVVRRLNYLISQSSNEQIKWGLRKFLYWRKCDEDAIRELHDAFVDFYRFYDHAADVSPIPSEGNRDEVTTRMFSVLEWCKQHGNELQSQLFNRPLLKDVEDLSVLATHICESFANWSSIVGNDTITIEIVNDIAMLLNNVIAPIIKKRNPTSTQPEPTPEAQPSPSVQATEKDDAAKNISITKIDADRLGSFFNAKFKGSGNNYNYFDDMIKDIQAIKVTKELAMIAVMIYDCRRYFIQRPSTFAAWLREFFEMIGRDCPKDHHKNKYTPNERIKRTFHYLS